VSLTTDEMVAALEPIIDDVTARYDAPTEFVLPGENRVAAALDLARAVVRRAERQAVAAARAGWLDGSAVVAYLNRLADLVYTLARWQEGTFRPVRTTEGEPGQP
jgi:cob(I)alamin adenosyltransferase